MVWAVVVEQERSEWESVISTSIWRTIPLPQHQRVASCLMEGLASCTMEAVATPVSLRFKKVLALSLAEVVALWWRLVCHWLVLVVSWLSHQWGVGWLADQPYSPAADSTLSISRGLRLQ